jgi:hypothetical protein
MAAAEAAGSNRSVSHGFSREFRAGSSVWLQPEAEFYEGGLARREGKVLYRVPHWLGVLPGMVLNTTD